MIAVILSEFKSWRLKFSKYSFIVLILLLFAASVISLLKPEFCAQVIIGFLIWLGWTSAKQTWSEIKYDEWINKSKLPVKSLMLGKILSLILIVFLHLFFIIPVFILMMIMRGVPLSTFLWAILLMIITAIFSLCLTFLFCWIELYSYEYFGTVMVIGWILLSLFIPAFYLINPFIQVKNILITKNIMLTLSTLGINLFLIISFTTFTGFFLYLNKRG